MSGVTRAYVFAVFCSAVMSVDYDQEPKQKAQHASMLIESSPSRYHT